MRRPRALRPPLPDARRRRLAAAALALAAWRLPAAAAAAAVPPLPASAPRASQARVFPPLDHPHRFTLAVDLAAPATPVNRRVLGSNVQWVDGGDDLLGADDRFDPSMLDAVQRLGPTVLRYPGGAHSDAYRFERGLGPQAQRGLNEHVNGRSQQRTRFGTREFLELCEATGAEPLITLNLVTGSVDEAARWLRLTNVERLRSTRTGAPLPKVMFWELGNEPYLTQERPDLALKPEEFARRCNATIAALRAVDPDIRIGLPLSTDRRNGIPVTHQPEFTRRVLGGLRARVDYLCLHDAYLPFAAPGPRGLPPDPAAMYWGAMAGTRAVAADWAALRRLVAAERPGEPALPLAITEHHAMFTLGQGNSDDLIASPAAALYVADLLRLFAQTPDLLLANQWSLSGNWRFGAIQWGHFPRAVAAALRLMNETLQGVRLPATWRGETVATPSVGLVGPEAAVPLVEALVTRQGDTLRVALIHKDPRRQGLGTLQLRAPAGTRLRLREARWQTWTCTDVFESTDQRNPWLLQEGPLPGFTPSPPAPGGRGRPAAATGAADPPQTLTLDLNLAPASLALLTLHLDPA